MMVLQIPSPGDHRQLRASATAHLNTLIAEVVVIAAPLTAIEAEHMVIGSTRTPSATAAESQRIHW